MPGEQLSSAAIGNEELSDATRRQQIASLANSLCERVSNRYNLLLAKGIFTADGLIPVFVCNEERAAYATACQHLSKCFGETEP